jgi:hypothetical protein
MSYTVEEHKYGMVVRGPIPISELVLLIKSWKRERGMDWCDAVVAEKLGASMVVCKKADSDLWRKELGIEPKEYNSLKLTIG